MYFPHEHVTLACAGDLNDPEYFRKVYGLLVTSQHADVRVAIDDKYQERFKSFLLEDLPPFQSLDRIKRKFETIAIENNARIREFRWWDIVPRTRSMLAVVTRDYQDFNAVFYWRRSADDYHPLVSHMFKTSLLRDGARWRVTFEAQIYQEVREQFRTWLTEPLKLDGGK